MVATAAKIVICIGNIMANQRALIHSVKQKHTHTVPPPRLPVLGRFDEATPSELRSLLLNPRIVGSRIKTILIWVENGYKTICQIYGGGTFLKAR